MSFSFSSLVRLLVLMAVGATMLAVGLSRLAPPQPSTRKIEGTRYTNINEFFLNIEADRTPAWLDAETGRMASFPLEDGDVLETASSSPWVDETNRFQAVGRWTTRTKEGPRSVSMDFGIARYSFPGGQMLDHVSTDIVPVGPPCWYPGTQARILFNAGDGLLYHFAFEPEPWSVAATAPQAARDLEPILIGWRCPKPGNGMVFLSDLSWPGDPRMGGCLIASLREQVSDARGIPKYSRNSIWWLKLNFAGTEIVDTGRLLVAPDPSSNDDHRNPTVGTLPDGRLALAYLVQRTREAAGWEVRLVPIEIDPQSRLLSAQESKSIALARPCLPAQPTFTADGRWLNAIAGPEAKDSRVIRISLDGLFGESSGSTP